MTAHKLMRRVKLYVAPLLLLLFIGLFLALKLWIVAVISAISLLSLFLGERDIPFFGEKRPAWLQRIHAGLTAPRRIAASAVAIGVGLVAAALTWGLTAGVIIGIGMGVAIHLFWLLNLATRRGSNRH